MSYKAKFKGEHGTKAPTRLPILDDEELFLCLSRPHPSIPTTSLWFPWTRGPPAPSDDERRRLSIRITSW